jgi:Rrf2 family nitric oxide-sensitive transcriptional repressor
VRVTKAEEYGIRLVMALAANGEQLSVRELAECEGLPEATIAKILARLRKADLVVAERGRNGGYSLAAPAADVTIAAVVGAFEDGMYDAGFCSRMNPDGVTCARASSCGLRPVWRGLTAVIGDFLSRITVADLLHGRAVPSIAPTDTLPQLNGSRGTP